MKNLIKILTLVIGISFLFTGCYTIVWDPSQEMPTQEAYSDNVDFYGSEYYGGYGSYYETPWWVGVPVYIVPPDNTTNKNQTKDRTNNGSSNNGGRTSDTENMRNSGERGNTDRNSGITTPPPTINSGSTNSSVTKTTSPTRDSGSNNNNSSNTSTTSSGSSSNDNRSSGSIDTRNNSGSRNSGSGRK